MRYFVITYMTNINTATIDELERVEGVTPELAQEIVNYREEYGRFDNVEDLMGVSGISEEDAEALSRKISF